MKKKISKNYISIIIVVVLLAIMAASTLDFFNKIEADVNKQACDVLNDIAMLQKDALHNRLLSDMNVLESLAITFEKGGFSIEEAAAVIGDVKDKSNFNQIGVFDLYGNGVSSDGAPLKILSEEFFESVNSKSGIIFEPIVSKFNDKYILKMITPVVNLEDNSIRYMLTGMYTLDDVKQFIELSFDDQGEIGIIDSKGILIFSNNLTADRLAYRTSYIDLFYSIAEFEDGSEDLVSNLKNGNSGVLTYTVNGETVYCQYEPLGINDWFIIFHVTKSRLVSTIEIHPANGILFIIIIGTCLALLVAYILSIRRKANQALYNVAFYDSLTGLPNNEKFRMEIKKIMTENKDVPFFCIIFDICNFKLINDRFGSVVGDKVLCAVADVIKSNMASAPKGMSSLAKLHSDTFVTFFPLDFCSDEDYKIDLFVEQCRNATNFIEDHKLNLSFGRYISQLGDTSEVVLERALTAHAHSKIGQPNIFVNYDSFFIEQLRIKTDILNNFDLAIQNGEFEVYIQPQFKTNSEEISGSEVLVRWNKDGKPKYYPSDFIPILEDTGKIYVLDAYTRERVCAAMEKWNSLGVDFPPISVNVSRVELMRKDFIEKIKSLMKKYNLDNSKLHIEITETAYTGDHINLINIVKELRDNGFYVEMDDFGSGYSSLNALKDIPVNVLKLDMKFIENGINSSKSGKILESLVHMAHSIDISTIAEGVETQSQVEYLRSINCDFMQGFYFAMPMPLKDFEAVILGSPIDEKWKLKNK